MSLLCNCIFDTGSCAVCKGGILRSSPQGAVASHNIWWLCLQCLLNSSAQGIASLTLPSTLLLFHAVRLPQMPHTAVLHPLDNTDVLKGSLNHTCVHPRPFFLDLLTTQRYFQDLYTHRYKVVGERACGQGDDSPLSNTRCLYSLSEWCTWSSLLPNWLLFPFRISPASCHLPVGII